MVCQSNTTFYFIMFIIVLGQHVSILTESSSGPSTKIDPYLKCLKMCCGMPNAYILDITMYKLQASFCSYYTIRTPNFKTLTSTYERDYMYILLLITKYVHISFKNVKTLKTMI